MESLRNNFMQFVAGHINVPVVSGGLYGFRETNPTVPTPHISVEIDDVQTYALELGSEHLEYTILFTIYARSYAQRDYLKTRLLYILRYGSQFPSGVIPIGPVTAEDIPSFEQERHYWVSTITMRVVSNE